MTSSPITNITLSGWAGVGTSTLTLLLAYVLERKLYPVTQMFRALDAHFNHGDKQVLSREFEETFQPSFGKLVDNYVDHILLHKSGIILESDIAAFRLGRHDKIFSIFVKADLTARNTRRISDGREGIETELDIRDEVLRQEYIKLWGIDIKDQQQIVEKHSLVLNTTDMTVAAELEAVYAEFKSNKRIAAEVDWQDLPAQTQGALEVYKSEGKDGLRTHLQQQGLWVDTNVMITEMKELFATEIAEAPSDLQEFFRVSTRS